MTTKLQYLKSCVLELTPLEDKRWYIGILSNLLVSPSPIDSTLGLAMRQQGIVYKTASDAYEESAIADAKLGEPLFKVTDKLVVDSSWLPSVKGQIDTTVGRLILNAAAVYPALGQKLAYINKPIKIKELESMIAEHIKDDDQIKDPSKDITIKEYLECIDRVWFFTRLSNLVSVASSIKTVLPPPGIDQLRKKLLAENAGKLSDPVVVATIVKALSDYDNEYLKDDPAAKFIVEGKGKTARKKLFHLYGETNDFSGALASDPITSTMQEGVDTSSDVLPKYMNDLRYASYSRGHSTQLAGYSYKILQRSLSGLEISLVPCTTKKGLVKTPTKPEQVVNRSVLSGNKWTLVESKEEAGKYLGKAVEFRSPMYCNATGNKVCYSCLGEIYKGNKNAINNIAAEFSSALMTLFLKRMHTSGFSLVEVKIDDLVT